MNEKTNPALRVYNILNQVSEMDDSKSLKDAWCDVLELSTGDVENLAYVPSLLINLLKETETRLENIKHIQNINFYYQPIRTIRNSIFNTHFSNQVKQLKEMIRTSMPSLAICSDLLNSNNSNELIVSKDDLRQLNDEAESLLQETLSAEIDNDVKFFLVDIINRFKQSIILYELKGANAFKDTFESSFGCMVLNAPTINSFDESSNEKIYASKVFKYMEQINNIAGFATNIQLALPYITELLKN